MLKSIFSSLQAILFHDLLTRGLRKRMRWFVFIPFFLFLLSGHALWSQVGVAEGAPLAPTGLYLGILNIFGCTVCRNICAVTLNSIQLSMERTGKKKISSYEVEDFTEHLCDPNNLVGAWTRRIGFFVVEDDYDNVTADRTTSSDSHKPIYRLEVRELPAYGKCKRACLTAQKMCSFLTDFSFFDAFVKEVASISQEDGPLYTPENVERLHNKVCSQYYACQNRDDSILEFAKLLNSNSKRKETIDADPPEYVSREELREQLTVYASQQENLLTRDDLEVLYVPLSFEYENNFSRGAYGRFLQSEKYKKNTSLPSQRKLEKKGDEWVYVDEEEEKKSKDL